MVQILAGQVFPVQKHQYAVFQEGGRAGSSQGFLALPAEKKGQVVKIVPGGYKGILDLHNRGKDQGAQFLRLSGQP